MKRCSVLYWYYFQCCGNKEVLNWLNDWEEICIRAGEWRNVWNPKLTHSLCSWSEPELSVAEMGIESLNKTLLYTSGMRVKVKNHPNETRTSVLHLLENPLSKRTVLPRTAESWCNINLAPGRTCFAQGDLLTNWLQKLFKRYSDSRLADWTVRTLDRNLHIR